MTTKMFHFIPSGARIKYKCLLIEEKKITMIFLHGLLSVLLSFIPSMEIEW